MVRRSESSHNIATLCKSIQQMLLLRAIENLLSRKNAAARMRVQFIKGYFII